MKKLIYFLSLSLLATFELFAQNSIITMSSQTVQTLNSNQLQNYNKINSHNIYKSLHLVQTGNIPDVDQGSVIYI